MKEKIIIEIIQSIASSVFFLFLISSTYTAKSNNVFTFNFAGAILAKFLKIVPSSGFIMYFYCAPICFNVQSSLWTRV